MSDQPTVDNKKGLKKAHIIIVGNEKGGSGKTTTTMHLIVSLLRLGFSVGTIDIDSRQRSLTRYIENRNNTIKSEGISMPSPTHFVITRSPFEILEEIKQDEKERFAMALSKVYNSCDFVIIDTPGNDTYLSRLSHSFADTIITPINDSFVDLDVLASVDGKTMEIIRPSIYSEMVWEQKLQRAKRDGSSIDWIVMRNRLSTLDAKNKRFMQKVTEELARRVGFRVAPGFSERVIYREMFLQGLTVLDIMDAGVKVSMSHITARQEVRDLLNMLQIEKIDKRIAQLRANEEEDELAAKPASQKIATKSPAKKEKTNPVSVKAMEFKDPVMTLTEPPKPSISNNLEKKLNGKVAIEATKEETVKIHREPKLTSDIEDIKETPQQIVNLKGTQDNTKLKGLKTLDSLLKTPEPIALSERPKPRGGFAFRPRFGISKASTTKASIEESA